MNNRQIVGIIAGIVVVVGILVILSIVQQVLQAVIPIAVLGAVAYFGYRYFVDQQNQSNKTIATQTTEEEAETVVVSNEEKTEAVEERLNDPLDSARRLLEDEGSATKEILDQIQERKNRLEGDQKL